MTTFRAADYINRGLLSVHNLLHVEDRKTAGTAGGTFTSGAWRTRDLNTVVTNTIAGASLASNQVTLPAGEYWVEGSAPCYKVNHHAVRLYNTTDSVELLTGQVFFATQSGSAGGVSYCAGLVELDVGKTIEFQHQCQTTWADSGLGTDASSSFVSVAVYSVLKIWKVG